MSGSGSRRFKVFLSSALNTEVLSEAGVTSIGTVVAMTTNSEVNAVLASRVLEEFSPPRVLAFCPDQIRDNSEVTTTDKRMRADVKRAFATHFSVKRWNQYYLDQALKLMEVTLSEEEGVYAKQWEQMQALIEVGELMPIVYKRQEKLRVCVAGEVLQAGDIVTVALHSPKELKVEALEKQVEVVTS